MKTYFIPILAAAFMMSCGDNNKPEDTTDTANERNDAKFDVMEKDADFAVKAAEGGMLEVMLADLALSKSSNADVKSLAEMMKTDHSAANSELQGLAKQKNISLPTALSPDKQKTYDKLNEKTGSDFDKEYCDMMVKDHKNDIDLFEKQSTNGADQEIRSWAAAKLPTLRHHLQMAENAQEKVK